MKRQDIVNAPASTIWKTCFEDLEFDKWDPDLKEISNKSTEKCEEGTKMTFVMKDGNILPMVLSNVKENESMTFAGGVLMNTLFGVGAFILTPVEDDLNKTKVDYSFELRGCLGVMLSVVNKDGLIAGTEHGLANVKEMSEKAFSENQG